MAGAMPERRQGIWRQGPTGVREHSRGQKGSQGTWDYRRSPWDQQPERVKPVINTQALGRRTSLPQRANQRSQLKAARRNAENEVSGGRLARA